MYDDLGLFQCFGFFGRREVLEAIDEFNDLQYLASTMPGGWPELYLPVLLYFFRVVFFIFYFSFFFLHFMMYSMKTVTEAF